MSTQSTPAVQRAVEAMRRMPFTPHDYSSYDVAREALTAALTDPDDPDALARTLYVLHAGAEGWKADDCLRMWADYEDERVLWRAVADGFRMMLTGSGS